MPLRHSGRARIGTLIGVAMLAMAFGGCAISGGGSNRGAGDASSTGALTTGSVAPEGSTAQTAVEPRRQGPIRVALLLPLSGVGTTAPVAKGLRQAAEMALIEQSGAPVQLVVKDDFGTPAGAKAAADEAIREGSELILGPLFAGSVEAVGPVARAAGVPVIAFSNDRRVAGNGTYLLSFQAELEAARIAAYAMAQGKRRFAVLAGDDAYGKITLAAFRSALTAGGGELVAVESYDPSANRSIDAVQKIGAALADWQLRGEPIDALFVPAPADTLATLAPQLAYAKVDPARVKLLGVGGWDSPGLGQHALLVGAWFPAPDPRGWRDFSERFARTFGQPAPRIATLAYDGVGIALALAEAKVPPVPGRSRFTSVDLARPTGFNGVDGPVRLAADGTAERNLAILEVQKIGTAVIEPASASFAGDRVAGGSQRLN